MALGAHEPLVMWAHHVLGWLGVMGMMVRVFTCSQYKHFLSFLCSTIGNYRSSRWYSPFPN